MLQNSASSPCSEGGRDRAFSTSSSCSPVSRQAFLFPACPVRMESRPLLRHFPTHLPTVPTERPTKSATNLLLAPLDSMRMASAIRLINLCGAFSL